MTQTIEQALNRMAEIVGGNAWGLDKGKPRIYMPLKRRDAKAYFDFADAAYSSAQQPINGTTTLGGAVLKIFIDDCGQAPQWYKSQREKLVSRFQREGLAIMAYEADESLAEAIMELDEIDDDQVNTVSGHLVNGRVAEARAALGM